jgi:hypothetical protein
MRVILIAVYLKNKSTVTEPPHKNKNFNQNIENKKSRLKINMK